MTLDDRRPAAVLFDCDGVLVESETLQNAVLAECLTAAGVPMTAAEVDARYLGATMQRVLDDARAHLGRSLPDGWLEDLRVRTFAVFERELQPVDGIADLLEVLRDADIPVAVASNGPPEKMECSLRVTGLRAHFRDRVFSSSMVPRGKPAPDVYLMAAAAVGVPPARAVVVEDSPTGVRAGVAAGMRVIARAHHADAAVLAAAGAETVARLAEVAGRLGLAPDLD